MQHSILRDRRTAVFCLAVLFVAAWTMVVGTPGASVARAAPEEKSKPQDAHAAPVKRTADAKPAREHAAPADKMAGGKTEKSDDKSGKTGEGTEPPSESFLLWLYKSMGLRYILVFLAITFNEVALVVMIILGLRRKSICPPELIAGFEAKVKNKQYQEAYELAKLDKSMLGKVLAAGMANLSEGYDEAVEAMQEVGEEETLRMEQRNGNVALIAQIGPMLGLLATVDGIVRAFSVIAHKEVTPKPSELAAGIGVALVNTVVGLTIAIISVVIYHYVRNRLSLLTFETGVVSGRLMKRFRNVKPASKTEA